MKAIIQESLTRSCSYEQYRNIITTLIKNGLSSGTAQSDELLNYSLLNETRMKRLEKTIEVPADIIADLQNLRKKYIWLVISEGWCGDAAQQLPVFDKMVQYAPNISLQIVFRDDNLELMDQFLTGTSRSIPKLIIIDKETVDVLGQYGPRPHGATELVRDYKQQHNTFDEKIKTELQLWYLHDKGLSTQRELTELMKIADR